VESVHREMIYQREREETHRNTNESTNARVVWYSVMTICAVAAVSIAQAFYMHNFLDSKRLLQRKPSRR